MRFFKIFLELTSSLSIAPGVDIGFMMKTTSKNKLGYDYFIPNKYFRVRHVLKVPKGYKFPDFPITKNYSIGDLKEREFLRKPYSQSSYIQPKRGIKKVSDVFLKKNNNKNKK